eukprot:m.163388 g.163388  ORF g.163388 m.163388 type:complete len:405 (+) comp23904_c0_seq1:476-1690(+)
MTHHGTQHQRLLEALGGVPPRRKEKSSERVVRVPCVDVFVPKHQHWAPQNLGQGVDVHALERAAEDPDPTLLDRPSPGRGPHHVVGEQAWELAGRLPLFPVVTGGSELCRQLQLLPDRGTVPPLALKIAHGVSDPRPEFTLVVLDAPHRERGRVEEAVAVASRVERDEGQRSVFRVESPSEGQLAPGMRVANLLQAVLFEPVLAEAAEPGPVDHQRCPGEHVDRDAGRRGIRRHHVGLDLGEHRPGPVGIDELEPPLRDLLRELGGWVWAGHRARAAVGVDRWVPDGARLTHPRRAFARRSRAAARRAHRGTPRVAQRARLAAPTWRFGTRVQRCITRGGQGGHEWRGSIRVWLWTAARLARSERFGVSQSAHLTPPRRHCSLELVDHPRCWEITDTDSPGQPL